VKLKLPKNHYQYYERIIERSKKYIKLGYWSEIDLAILERWLNNFNSEEEKYFSALILDKIIYRNEMTIKSMFSKMFHITLPNILEEKEIYLAEMNLEEWEKTLKNPIEKNKLPFRFTTITSEKELGDSGSDFMRRLRKYYLVNRELIIRIDNDKDNCVNTLIVIDDLIASGEQTKTFIEENLPKINEYRYVIFMPLMAHVAGVSNVNEKKRNLEYTEQLNENTIYIKPIELISEENSFFYEKDNTKLIDGENTIQEIKDFYTNFIKNKFKTSEIYGVGSLSLLLMLSSGMPDNTLPIIHETNENTNWYALYEKF
jgi:hypothetical protein